MSGSATAPTIVYRPGALQLLGFFLQKNRTFVRLSSRSELCKGFSLYRAAAAPKSNICSPGFAKRTWAFAAPVKARAFTAPQPEVPAPSSFAAPSSLTRATQGAAGAWGEHMFSSIALNIPFSEIGIYAFSLGFSPEFR